MKNRKINKKLLPFIIASVLITSNVNTIMATEASGNGILNSVSAESTEATSVTQSAASSSSAQSSTGKNKQNSREIESKNGEEKENRKTSESKKEKKNDSVESVGGSEKTNSEESVRVNEKANGEETLRTPKNSDETDFKPNTSPDENGKINKNTVSTYFADITKSITKVSEKDNEWEVKTVIQGKKIEDKTDTVILIDTSSNMAENNRLANAKEKAKTLVNELLTVKENKGQNTAANKEKNGQNSVAKNGNRVAIVSFNGYVRKLSDFSDKPEELKKNIDSLYTAWYWEDGAFTQRAIKTARDMLNKDLSARNKNIVILSYGKSSYGYKVKDNEKASKLQTERTNKVDLTKRIFGIPWRHQRKSNGLLVLDFLTIGLLKTQDLNEDDFDYTRWIGNGDDEHTYFDLKTAGNPIAAGMAKIRIKEYIPGFDSIAERIANYATNRYDYKYYDLGYNAIAETNIARKNGINVHVISVEEAENKTQEKPKKNEKAKHENIFEKYLKDMANKKNYYNSIDSTVKEKLANKLEKIKLEDEIHDDFEVVNGSDTVKNDSKTVMTDLNKENNVKSKISITKYSNTFLTYKKEKFSIDNFLPNLKEGEKLEISYKIKLKDAALKKKNSKGQNIKVKAIEPTFTYTDKIGEHPYKFNIGEVDYTIKSDEEKKAEAKPEETASKTEVAKTTETTSVENSRNNQSENSINEMSTTNGETPSENSTTSTVKPESTGSAELPKESQEPKETSKHNEEKSEKETNGKTENTSSSEIGKTNGETEKRETEKRETDTSNPEKKEESTVKNNGKKDAEQENNINKGNTESESRTKKETVKEESVSINSKGNKEQGRNNNENAVRNDERRSSHRSSRSRNRNAKKTGEKISITRLNGINRFETAARISKAEHTKADKVIISNAYKFSDILSASPYAKQINAPILYADANSIPETTMNEISRLDAKEIIIAGGVSSISAEVETSLKAKGYRVLRIGGKNRYETSSMIANQMIQNYGVREDVIIASGEDYPDALSISSLANRRNLPILLTESKGINIYLKTLLNNRKINRLYIAGGETSVSENVIAESKMISQIKEVIRYGGVNRYETASIIAKNTLPNAKSVVLASGENFADALAVSTFAAKNESPILLTGSKTMSSYTKDYIANGKIKNVKIAGGNVSVSQSVEKEISRN